MNDSFLGNGELVSSVWFNVLECMAWHAVRSWFTAQLRNPPWLGAWDTVLDQVTVHFLEQSGNTWMYSSWCFHHSFCFVNLLDVIAQLDHMNVGKHLSQWISRFILQTFYKAGLRSEAWRYVLAHKITKMTIAWPNDFSPLYYLAKYVCDDFGVVVIELIKNGAIWLKNSTSYMHLDADKNQNTDMVNKLCSNMQFCHTKLLLFSLLPNI